MIIRRPLFLSFSCGLSSLLLATSAQAQQSNETPTTTAAADTPAPAGSEWQPLDIDQFGNELTSKWIPVPNGSSGAPRQGWLATADGFFTREAHLAYDYTDARVAGRHQVLGRFNYPWSRRFWTGIELPFYQESGGRSNFGDITLTTLVMLHENRNTSINAGVAWRLPTGSTRLGNNRFVPTPQVNFFTDIGHGFALRGRLGYEIADRGGSDAVNVNFAIGQTVTPHNKAPFGDLTWYVSANWREPTNGLDRSFVSITPGARTHLGGNLFLLAGVEFPVTPTRNSFDQRYIVQLVQGF